MSLPRGLTNFLISVHLEGAKIGPPTYWTRSSFPVGGEDFWQQTLVKEQNKNYKKLK
jgi:hypothetical protein